MALIHASLTLLHVDLQSIAVPSGWTEYVLVAVGSCMTILLQAGPIFLTVGWVFVRLGGVQRAAFEDDEDEPGGDQSDLNGSTD